MTAKRPWLRNTVLAVLLGLPLLTALAGWLLASVLAAALKDPVPLGDASLTLRAVNHGLLSTRLHYTLEWPLGNGKRVQLALEQRLDPGPWPWLTLEHGDYAPALLASTLQATHAVVGPEGALETLPVQLELALRVGMNGSLWVDLQAHVPDLPLGAVSVQAEQLRVRVQHRWWNQSVDTALQAQRLGLRQGGEESVRLEGIDHRVTGTLGARSQLLSKATVQQLALWGEPIGPLSHALDVHDVDGDALVKAMGGDTNAWPQALPPGVRLNGMLLSVQHPQAATQIRVHASPDPTPTLAVDIVIPKRSLVEPILAAPALDTLRRDASPLAQQQAQMAYAFIRGQLLASGWLQDHENGLRGALEFGPTGTVVNGEAMSWEAFKQRFFPPKP